MDTRVELQYGFWPTMFPGGEYLATVQYVPFPLVALAIPTLVVVFHMIWARRIPTSALKFNEDGLRNIRNSYCNGRILRSRSQK